LQIASFSPASTWLRQLSIFRNSSQRLESGQTYLAQKKTISFAGENYELPVISPKARSLLSRHSDHCDRYDLSDFEWPPQPESALA